MHYVMNVASDVIVF